MKKSILWAMLTASVLFCCFCVSAALAAGRGVTNDTVKLGLIMVKTGPVAAMGNSQSQGLKDYLHYVNDQGGINGRKIDLIHEDDQFKADLSVAAFKKLMVRDKVLAIVSCGGTPQQVANFANIQKYKSCCIPNSLAEEMYKPYKEYIFNIGASYEHQIAIMLEYIFNDFGAKSPKIGLVYAETEFGKACLAGAKKHIAKYNTQLAAEVVLPVGSVDASSQVLSLQKAGVDIVIFSCLIPDTVTFLKAAEKYGYSPPVFAINWATDDIILRLAGSAAKNLIGVNYTGAWNEDTPGTNLAREIAAKYGSKPPLTSLYMNGMAEGALFAEAMKRAGKNLTPDTLKTAFETFRNYDTQGIVPPVTWKKGDHSPANMVKFYKADLDKVQFAAITGWRKTK
jgi:branched-chain amino acid transport system substrate-binding protein